MTTSPRLRFLALRVICEGREAALPLAGEASASDVLRGTSLPAILRAALDGTGTAPAGVEHVALDIDVAGQAFRVERGAASRLVRVTPEGEQVLAEGDAFVTEFLARLGGASEPLGRRVVARVADVSSWLRRELEAGEAGALHAAITADLEAAATALGARLRDLLRRAHGLLQDATDDLSPGRDEPLTPEDLGSLRDGVVMRLGGASGRLDKLAESLVAAEALEAKLRERHARMQEYLKAEQLGRKLERQQALMEGNRRRLERARAAAKLTRPGGGGGTSVNPEKRARERAEREADEARAELSRARIALAQEESREPEREAVGAWIVRLSEMKDALLRLQSLQAELDDADRRVQAAEKLEREAGDEHARATAALAKAQQALVALQASPEDAMRAHDEAARAARLAEDVRRLATVRDQLRDRARDVQLAKIAVERVEEELELAQREIDWNRNSTQPRAPSDLPSVPDLVARRVKLEREVEEASAALTATREELRQRTSSLGTQAYLSPELLEAEAREKAERSARFGTAGRSRAEIGQEIADLTMRASVAARDRDAAGAEIRELALLRIRHRETIAELQGAIPAHLRERAAIEAALQEARGEHAQRLEAWDAARKGVRAADERASRAESAVRAAREAEASASRRMIDLGSDLAPLRQAGFADWSEVEEARLTDDEMSAIEEELKEHETLERLVEDGRRMGTDDALLPRADPAQAALMHALLAHAREIGEERRAVLAQQLNGIDRWLDALDEIGAELESVEHAAGLSEDAGRGASFEDRVREALPRRVLARAEGRLSRWQRPWSLQWGGSAGAPRPLVLRDAESGGAPAAQDVLAAEALALALAVELALAGEPVGTDLLVVDGSAPLPPEAGEGLRWLRA